MFFNSLAFLVFFLIVFTIYWSLPYQRLRVYLLLAASFYFYASWDEALAMLVVSTTIADYIVARCMCATRSQELKKFLVAFSVVMNLGVLAYFKYRNFFLESLQQGLHAIGDTTTFEMAKLIVPFGISFYTFEAISYSVDVFRGKIKAERNLPNFMLFILFFPHLVSGPIVRAGDFLPQTHRPKRFSWLRMQAGVQFFLMGLFKKMAIADRMAVYSTPVFEDPTKYSTGSIWIALLAFAIRIYCDFSGYSDMAVGCAHMLGYKLTLNFRMPYLAPNVQDFWHRWHISLSTWLRDYLYFPLGGSRGSAWFAARNTMIVMTLGGLWHGATWSYVVWGVLHGCLLVGHRFFKEWAKDKQQLRAWLDTSVGYALRMALTFLAVMLCWVFFQPSLEIAVTMLQRMFVPTPGTEMLPLHPRSLWYTIAFMALCHYIGAKGLWKTWSVRLPAPALGFGYATALTLALVLAPDAGQAFIYFQF